MPFWFFLVFLASLGLHFVPEQSDWLIMSQLIIFSSIVLFIFTQSLRHSLRSKSHLFNRIFQVDHIWFAALALFLLQQDKSGLMELAHTLFIVQIFSGAWVGVRMMEAFQLRKSWKKNSSLELNPRILSEYERSEARHLVILSSLVLLIGLSLQLSSQSLVVALILAFAPLSWWWLSELAQSAGRWGVQFHELERLKAFRSSPFIRSHLHGVFTRSSYDFVEKWIDPSAAWSEAELLSMSFGLCQHSAHPVSQCLQDSLPRKNSFKIEISDVTEAPHIGLFAQVRDDRGQPLELRLASLSYLATAGHATPPEAFKLISKWRELSYSSVFLSINKQVVCGFALFAPLRKGSHQLVEGLSRQSLALGLMSSQEPLAHAQEIQCQSRGFRLLPIERQLQINRWSERETGCLEIRSSWDAGEEKKNNELIWQERREDFLEQADQKKTVRIFSNDMRSLVWLLDRSRELTRKNWIFLVLGLLACLAILFLNSFIFQVLGVLFLYLLILVFSKLGSGKYETLETPL